MYEPAVSFIEKRIIEDLAQKKYTKIRTRFPPEPNGYLHLGHAKSIFFNFGLAEKYSGECNLRFDDTNPSTEEQSYVDMIKKDLEWLGVKWANCFYASDYFPQFYLYAIALIKQGFAYVDEQTSEEVRMGRGDWHAAGVESPYRNRSISENLVAFEMMKKGQFQPGTAVLRAKIDMSAANVLLRDPILYRVKFVAHHQTKKEWVIFPTYDFAHCLSDAIEKISHSICTLEFQDNRALYDWILDTLQIKPRPYQHEFARLNVEGVVLSKRKLIALIEKKVVDGWDDPRMPTLCAFRRRGYPAQALKLFCQRLGIAKQDNCVEFSALETCAREILNEKAPRTMMVVDPIKLVIKNIAPEEVLSLRVPRHPFNAAYGQREIQLGRELYISRSDFQEIPSRGYKRLSLGNTVRLRYGIVIRADAVEYDEAGQPVLIQAEADLQSLGVDSQILKKPQGVIHWVFVKDAVQVEVRRYDRLFLENLEEGRDSEEDGDINPNSLKKNVGMIDAKSLQKMFEEQQAFQCEREGYFCLDRSLAQENVLHETVSLKATKKVSL